MPDRWISEELFDHVPMAICVVDQQFRIVEANERFTELYGEWRGRFCYEVYKDRNERCARCGAAKTFRDGKTRQREEAGRRPPGKPHPLRRAHRPDRARRRRCPLRHRDVEGHRRAEDAPAPEARGRTTRGRGPDRGRPGPRHQEPHHGPRRRNVRGQLRASQRQRGAPAPGLEDAGGGHRAHLLLREGVPRVRQGPPAARADDPAQRRGPQGRRPASGNGPHGRASNSGSTWKSSKRRRWTRRDSTPA